jgi:hypothetical protein
MVTKQIKELEVTKAKIVALEKSIAKRLRKELASLHDKYGFSSLQEFIKALKGSSGGSPRKAASKAKPARPARPAPRSPSRWAFLSRASRTSRRLLAS